jgi:WhiB family transcriptional regulator, redox-sensing transcriptional regulator
MSRHGYHRKNAGVGGTVHGSNDRLIDFFAVLAPRAAAGPPAAAEDLSWQDQAVCAEVGGDFWFPEKGGSTREPKKVCHACPVRAECLEYALKHDERFGVWGGLSERERRRLKRPPPAGRPRSEAPASRFRGVTWMAPLGKWQARANLGGERVYVGTFTDDEEAARAVTEAEAAYQVTQSREVAA